GAERHVRGVLGGDDIQWGSQGRVDEATPGAPGGRWGNVEELGFAAGVEDRVEVTIGDSGRFDGAAVDGECKGLTGVGPIGLVGLVTMPDDVWGQRALWAGTAKEGVSAERRMALAQGDHLADEAQEIGVLGGQRPVDPAGLIVLAPGVIV